MKIQYSSHRRKSSAAVAVGLLTGTATSAMALALGFWALPPEALPPPAAIDAVAGFVVGKYPLHDVTLWLHRIGAWPDARVRLLTAGGFGLIGLIAGATTWLPHCGWKLADGWRQKRGRVLALPPDGYGEAKRWLHADCKRTGTRIHLAPGVPFPFEHEVLGMLLVGAPGSGKTQALWWLLRQWLATPDTRLIVVDAGKGDFVSMWPDDNFALLAPHDDRCGPGGSLPQAMAWDIAADVTSFQDAAELATRVVLESDEPQWAEGARLILQGVIVGLQKRYGLKWGWREFHDAVRQSDSDLNAWITKYWPEALSYVALDNSGKVTKNAASYVNNFRSTVMKMTLPLSLAWGDVPPSRRLSMRQWLLSEGKGGPRTILLARSGQFAAMSAAWIGSVVQLIASVVESPALSESPSRRILLVLDELRQISAKGDKTKALVEVGRSKGVGVVACIQTLEQLPEVWGREPALGLETMIKTRIFGRLSTTSSDDAGANAVAKNVVGMGYFERVVYERDGTGRRTQCRKDDTRLVVDPEFFEWGVGVHDKGFRAALVLPKAMCLLDWPFTTLPRLRLPVVHARWIDGLSDEDYNRLGYRPGGADPQAEDNAPRHGWVRRMREGWRAGAGEGVTGRLGGLASALLGED